MLLRSRPLALLLLLCSGPAVAPVWTPVAPEEGGVASLHLLPDIRLHHGQQMAGQLYLQGMGHNLKENDSKSRLQYWGYFS
jgi:hypothetical protein